jgi:hypothetical protein
MSGYDLGHGYVDSGDPSDEQKVVFWVFGTLDEFQSLGLLDVAGDSPLKDHEQRKRYRKLRDSGFKPPISDVAKVLRKYSIEGIQSGLLAKFQRVIAEGMKAFKQNITASKRA